MPGAGGGTEGGGRHAGEAIAQEFDPDTTGSVALLFRDESDQIVGQIVGEWGMALPTGDFATG